MHGSFAADPAFVRSLYWWSFGARLVMGLFGWYATVYLNFSLMEDGLFYDELAAKIADDWLTRNFTSPTLEEAVVARRPVPQLLFLAAVYFFTGGRQLTPVSITAYSLLTAWAPLLVYRMGERLGMPERAARLGAWLVAFSPAFVFWSGALYKEGLILVILTFGLLNVLRLQEQWSAWSLIKVVLAVVGLHFTRFYLVLGLGLVFVLGLLLGRSRSGNLRQVVVTGVVLVLMVLSGFSAAVQETLPSDISEGLSRMQSSREDLATSARSGYRTRVDLADQQQAL